MKPLPLKFSTPLIQKFAELSKTPIATSASSSARSRPYRLQDAMRLVRQLAKNRPAHLAAAMLLLDHFLHDPDGVATSAHACLWFSSLDLSRRRRGHAPVVKRHKQH